MDRRQRKTREAIFKAFTELLSEEKLSKITVGQIIERADIGRATFYAHFETKDYLLKEFCEELFGHIFDSAEKSECNNKYIFRCDAPDSVFLHLFYHIKNNDNHLSELLSCQNNELFLQYFKNGLLKLIESQISVFGSEKAKKLPYDYWINHIASSFVETVKWWTEHNMEQSPETITKYFLEAIQEN